MARTILQSKRNVARVTNVAKWGDKIGDVTSAYCRPKCRLAGGINNALWRYPQGMGKAAKWQDGTTTRGNT